MDSEVDSEMDSEMNRDNDVEKFWNCIERKMAIIFPQYLRNILKFLGYDSAATVRAITQEDIDEKFEKFEKTKMIPYVPTDAKQEDYFYYFRKPELFYIIPGHKILLKQVVDSTRKMTEKYGIDYFNFYKPFDDPINHIKPIRKRNLTTQKSKQHLTATVTKEHQPNPDTEQVYLFEKIQVWLEKYKESSTSIKYTYPISLASIDMAEEVDENNIEKMVAMVPCPICGIKKRVTQVFTENTSPYMSLSNYQRHVRSHKEQEEKKVSLKRRNQSDLESEIKDSRKKRNLYTTEKGKSENQVLSHVDTSEFPSESEVNAKQKGKSDQKRAATSRESVYESVMSTKSKNNENSSTSSNESDASQNIQEIQVTQCEVHQNPAKVLTQIPKKQNVRPLVLSTKSRNNDSTSTSDSEASENTQEIRAVKQNSDKVSTQIPKKQNVRSAASSTTSSSDSDTSQNIQEIKAADAYEREQKWQSSRRNSSDSESSASGMKNNGNQNKAVSKKNGNTSPREKPEPGKKKVYRKRSNMRSNFLITEAKEDNRAETKTKDVKKKPKKPFNRFV